MAKKPKKSKRVKKTKKKPIKKVNKKSAKKIRKKSLKSKSRKKPKRKSVSRSLGRIRSGLISTGSTGFNKLLGGGIRKGSAILIHGTPHCGKKPLLMKIGYTNISKGVPVIFVLTDFGVNSWERMMRGSKWYLRKHWKNVYFVDLYSTQFGACPVGDNITCVPVPYSLGRISIEVSNFIDKLAKDTNKKPIVIFHSLSTLLQNFDDTDVFKFMQFFVGKLRSKEATGIFSLQAGIHIAHVETLHRGLMDGVIEMGEGKIRAIGFGRTQATSWATCSIKGPNVVVTPIKKEKSDQEEI